jgi:hypothetical protein
MRMAGRIALRFEEVPDDMFDKGMDGRSIGRKEVCNRIWVGNCARSVRPDEYNRRQSRATDT